MTHPVSPAAPGARVTFGLLDEAGAGRVLDAALERLEAVGVVPACGEAREALMTAGARGAGDETLRLDGDRAMAAAAAAPERVVLGDRGGAGETVLLAGAGLLAAGGQPAARVHSGGETHGATAADLIDACRLADALPDVAVVAAPPVQTDAAVGRVVHGSPGVPGGPEGTGGAGVAGDAAASDVVMARDGASPLAGAAVTLRTTAKHLLVVGVTSATEAVALCRMAAVLRGDDEDLRRRPPLSLLGGAGSFAAALTFARAGLPAGALVETPAGAAGRGLTDPAGTAPADRAPAVSTSADRGGAVTDALVRYLADVLAANAAVQGAAPGAAFVAPVCPALAGLPATGPETTAFMVAATQVLARAGLPAAAGAFATSAPGVDWKAGTEGSFAVLACLMAGAALVTGAGTLCGGADFSPAQLVADAEIHSWCAKVAAGIPVDEETLAVDVIRQVDACGNFLGQKHTRRHMKDVWRPRLLDRTAWDAWVAGGRKGAAEKAVELAGTLLAQHEVALLDAETEAKLQRIIATAGL